MKRARGEGQTELEAALKAVEDAEGALKTARDLVKATTRRETERRKGVRVKNAKLVLNSFVSGVEPALFGGTPVGLNAVAFWCHTYVDFSWSCPGFDLFNDRNTVTHKVKRDLTEFPDTPKVRKELFDAVPLDKLRELIGKYSKGPIDALLDRGDVKFGDTNEIYATPCEAAYNATNELNDVETWRSSRFVKDVVSHGKMRQAIERDLVVYIPPHELAPYFEGIHTLTAPELEDLCPGKELRYEEAETDPVFVELSNEE